MLSWLPNTTDLNPIEHLWDMLNHKVNSTELAPYSLKQLKEFSNNMPLNLNGKLQKFPRSHNLLAKNQDYLVRNIINVLAH